MEGACLGPSLDHGHLVAPGRASREPVPEVGGEDRDLPPVRHGARPGEDVFVVGFNNVSLARVMSVPLTTIASPMQELGAAAHQIAWLHPEQEVLAVAHDQPQRREEARLPRRIDELEIKRQVYPSPLPAVVVHQPIDR